VLFPLLNIKNPSEEFSEIKINLFEEGRIAGKVFLICVKIFLFNFQ
jgi:hypothetical protein